MCSEGTTGVRASGVHGREEPGVAASMMLVGAVARASASVPGVDRTGRCG